VINYFLMKKSLHLLFITAIVSVTVVCARATEAVSDAIVLKAQAGAQARLPGQAVPAEIKAGDKLPQGTVIQTSNKSEVEIQAFSGSTTVIKPGTKVELSKLSLTSSGGVITKQTALLNLTIGTLVSTLDPANKSINDYSIRTPKGVAAARGTIYTVTVSETGAVRTFVARGVVVFFNPTTHQEVTVQEGYAVVIDAQGNIGEPVEATEAQKEAAKEAFKKDPEKDRAIDITVVSPSS